ncbi:YbaB/EbfC family nucleoid-associated protein [uncultured Dokdonia sp.]|uniref:YbaB/EbfC family nucleoid-associated protein n=1 Tax=uncultured Dokdonia sp. TaxID=575653 RepID=UPI00260CC8BF|nr:YbaB/EbfC family nucleoid-associated protein [uncultured Dokdonia sp.]
MFGDMMGLMGKLQEAKAKAEATKERLKTVLVDEQSSDGLLKVTATASGRIKEIELSENLLQDKEQLEDYLILTINKALEKAQNIHDTEMGAVAKEGMPNIPGMDLFK